MAHPSTYLNKILLGSRQGQLQLWNIRTCKLVCLLSHTQTTRVSSLYLQSHIETSYPDYPGLITVLTVSYRDLIPRLPRSHHCTYSLIPRPHTQTTQVSSLYLQSHTETSYPDYPGLITVLTVSYRDLIPRLPWSHHCTYSLIPKPHAQTPLACLYIVSYQNHACSLIPRPD